MNQHYSQILTDFLTSVILFYIANLIFQKLYILNRNLNISVLIKNAFIDLFTKFILKWIYCKIFFKWIHCGKQSKSNLRKNDIELNLVMIREVCRNLWQNNCIQGKQRERYQLQQSCGEKLGLLREKFHRSQDQCSEKANLKYQCTQFRFLQPLLLCLAQ